MKLWFYDSLKMGLYNLLGYAIKQWLECLAFVLRPDFFLMATSLTGMENNFRTKSVP